MLEVRGDWTVLLLVWPNSRAGRQDKKGWSTRTGDAGFCGKCRFLNQRWWFNNLRSEDQPVA